VLVPTAASSLHPCERILVVDDHDDILETLRDVLELEGAHVETAASAHEADRVLDAGFRPSVVVVDVRLGGGESGEEYARRLQDAPRTASVPVVLMSGDVHELRRLGPVADATLVKPFEMEQLFGVLAEMCREHARALLSAGES
jgi:two-component system CheB/CheR fusion protein